MARKGDCRDLLALWQEESENGGDAVRHLLEVVIQRLLEEEMTAFLGAEANRQLLGRNSHPLVPCTLVAHRKILYVIS